MKIKWYWSLNGIPEFSRMPISERRKNYWTYLGRVIRRLEHVLVLVIYFALIWLLGPSILIALAKNINSLDMKILVMSLSIGLFGGLSGFLYSEFVLHLIANQIRRENTLKENKPK